jgi:pilus assembly protein CpaE
MDVPGVRGLRKELDVLTELGLVPDGRHLVLTFAGPAGGLAMADIVETVGAPLDVVLPRHDAALLATNTGVPLLQKGGKDPVTRGLQALLARIAPRPAAPAGRRARRRAGAR